MADGTINDSFIVCVRVRVDVACNQHTLPVVERHYCAELALRSELFSEDELTASAHDAHPGKREKETIE